MAPRPLTFILGGARSGKSDYGERLAASLPGPVVIVVTGEARDAEMARRIAAHRKRRPHDWRTVEAPRDLAESLRGLPDAAAVLIDDLGMLVTHHLLDLVGDRAIDGGNAPVGLEPALHERIEAELDAISARRAEGGSGHTIVVSNEVGMGVVPASVLGRLFQDALGRANQLLAARADNVVLCVAGIPTIVKGIDPLVARS